VHVFSQLLSDIRSLQGCARCGFVSSMLAALLPDQAILPPPLHKVGVQEASVQ